MDRISRPAWGSIALTFLFIAITAWWLSKDRRIPEFDPGLHMVIAFQRLDEVQGGDLMAMFTTWSTYAPLVHSVGLVTAAVVGKGVWTSVLGQNIVFVPLLALGCYQTGKLVFDDARAGLLAVVFALGTPMVVGQFHGFLLDAPETAMVAVSVWLLLASRKFERLEYAALAGLAVGLGMLTKQTYSIFVVGLILALVAAGGWRQWRGLLAFVAVAAIVAGPWHLYHLDEFQAQLTKNTASPNPDASLPPEIASLTPPRFSSANFQWYFWTTVNYQILAPFFAFVVVGVVLAIMRLRRGQQQLTLFLMIGGFVAWFGITQTFVHDARYILPALVYLAVLGTGWIVSLPTRWRLVVSGLLAAIAAMNVFGSTLGVGERLTLALPGAPEKSGVNERKLSFYPNDGFVFGEPERSGDLLSVLNELKDDGARELQWEELNAQERTFSNMGLTAFAMSADLTPRNASPSTASADQPFLVHKPIRSGDRPCVELYDGTGVWVYIGSPKANPPKDACPR